MHELTQDQFMRTAACVSEYKAKGFVQDEWRSSLNERLVSPTTVLPVVTPGAPEPNETQSTEPGDPVATKCATLEEKLVKDLNWTIITVRITHSQKWGTIWRADIAPPGDINDPSIWYRTACSEHSVVHRPLEMFDPSQSIPPLK